MSSSLQQERKSKNKESKKQQTQYASFSVKVCFFSQLQLDIEGRCFVAYKLLFLCAMPHHQNGAFHQRQSGWACRLSDCLSAALLLLSSQQPPALSTWARLLCTALFWMGFFLCRAHGALSSFQVLERRDLALQYPSELYRQSTNGPDCIKKKHRHNKKTLSFLVPSLICVRFPEEVLFVFSLILSINSEGCTLPSVSKRLLYIAQHYLLCNNVACLSAES